MLIWADGFDHYGTQANMTKGSYVRADVGLSNNPANIRTGTGALDITGGDNSDKALVRPVTINGNTIGVGFALLTTANPPGDRRFTWRCNDANGALIFQAAFNGNSGIDIITAGVTVASTPPLVLVPGSYSYIEIAYTIDPTQGHVVLRINNAPVIDVADLNTLGDSQTGIPYSVGFYKPGGASSTWPTWYLDDYVIWDASGDANNNFFGDIRCRTIYPEANGLNQNWTPNGLADAFACVAQVPPQPNVDYISAANVGDISSFDLQGVPVNTGAVYGVMMHVNLNKADAGACTVSAGVATGGQAAFADPINPGTGPAFYSKAFQKTPEGDAWNKDKVNAMQALIERVA